MDWHISISVSVFKEFKKQCGQNKMFPRFRDTSRSVFEQTFPAELSVWFSLGDFGGVDKTLFCIVKFPSLSIKTVWKLESAFLKAF